MPGDDGLGGGDSNNLPLNTLLHRQIVETKTSGGEVLSRWEFSASQTEGGCEEDPDASGEIYYYGLWITVYDRASGAVVKPANNIVSMYNPPFQTSGCSLPTFNPVWTSDKTRTELTLVLGDNCGNRYQKTYDLEPLHPVLTFHDNADYWTFDANLSTGNIVRYQLTVTEITNYRQEGYNPLNAVPVYNTYIAYDGFDPKMPITPIYGAYRDTYWWYGLSYAYLTVWDDMGNSAQTEAPTPR
jgi:hypothetical protein